MKRTIAAIMMAMFVLTQTVPAFALKNQEPGETQVARAVGGDMLGKTPAPAAGKDMEKTKAGSSGGVRASANGKAGVLSKDDLTRFVEKFNRKFDIYNSDKRTWYKVMSYRGTEDKKRDIKEDFSGSMGVQILLSSNSGYEKKGFGGDSPYLLIHVDRKAIETIGDLSDAIYHQIKMFKKSKNRSPSRITDTTKTQEYDGYYCEMGFSKKRLITAIEGVAASLDVRASANGMDESQGSGVRGQEKVSASEKGAAPAAGTVIQQLRAEALEKNTPEAQQALKDAVPSRVSVLVLSEFEITEPLKVYLMERFGFTDWDEATRAGIRIDTTHIDAVTLGDLQNYDLVIHNEFSAFGSKVNYSITYLLDGKIIGESLGKNLEVIKDNLNKAVNTYLEAV